MFRNNVIHVIIPAYNEEQSITKVIAEIPHYVDKIIVADNNSTDNTAQASKEAGAEIVFEKQQGYGAACLKGIEYSKQFNPDIIVFLDGDYSDYPQDMDLLLHSITEKNYDIVVGSRVRGKKEKGALLPQAIVGNFIACTLIRLFWGVKFSDLGPFRALRFDSLSAMCMEDRTWGWTVEMQIKAAKMGMKCDEVPVRYRKRVGKSKITGTFSGSIKAGYKILYTIFKYSLRK